MKSNKSTLKAALSGAAAGFIVSFIMLFWLNYSNNKYHAWCIKNEIINQKKVDSLKQKGYMLLHQKDSIVNYMQKRYDTTKVK